MMTGRALRSALGLWFREPKAMLLMNIGWALPAYMGLALAANVFRSGQGSYGPWVAIPLLLAVWMAFSLLVRAIGQIDRGQRPTWSAARIWLQDAWAPRLVLGLVWIEITYVLASALMHDGLSALPKAALALGLAAWTWLSLGLLFSTGLDARLEQAPWAAQKAGLMAAVAFLPASIALVFWTLWLGGPLAFVAERTQWWARFLWAPLILAPVFTPSFYAAYLYFLAQAVKDRSQGKPPLEGAPTLKEILLPWR